MNRRTTAAAAVLLATGLSLTGCQGRAATEPLPSATTTSTATDQAIPTATPTPTPTPTPSVSPPAAPVAAAICADAFDAEVDYDDPTLGFGFFVLTNTGPSICTLTGFATAALVGSDGSDLSTQHDSDAFATADVAVDVAPGGNAYIWMHWINAATMNGDCTEQQHVDHLALTLPGATTPLRIDTSDLTACLAPENYRELQIGPVSSEQQSASKGY